MFRLTEAASWSEDETLIKVLEALPVGWRFREERRDNTYYGSVTDGSDSQLWAGFGQDRKVMFLDCLGWLMVRDHKTKNPMWRARDTEVPLYRPPISPSPVPDPPDLDPDVVASVYKSS